MTKTLDQMREEADINVALLNEIVQKFPQKFMDMEKGLVPIDTASFDMAASALGFYGQLDAWQGFRHALRNKKPVDVLAAFMWGYASKREHLGAIQGVIENSQLTPSPAELTRARVELCCSVHAAILTELLHLVEDNQQ